MGLVENLEMLLTFVIWFVAASEILAQEDPSEGTFYNKRWATQQSGKNRVQEY